MESDGDSDSIGSERRPRRHKRDSQKKKDRKKHRKRKRHDENDAEGSSEEEEDRSHHRHKKEKRQKHKREKKKRKHRKEKKGSRRHDENDDSQSEEEDSSNGQLQRNYALADALMSLLEKRPALVEDLPIILVRMASATTFDTNQMTDVEVATGLTSIFNALQPIGVMRDESDGSWYWPAGRESSNHTEKQQLILVRVVRTMLEQIGLTMDAVEEYENPTQFTAGKAEAANRRAEELKYSTLETLRQFKPELATELSGLCQMILDGESIALDGLEDVRLKSSLETIFQSCGLEKVEMEDNGEDGDNSSDGNANEGYALPEQQRDDSARNITLVMNACKETSSRPRVKGPMRPPPSYVHDDAQAQYQSSSDEEGPSIISNAKRRAALSDEAVEEQAKRRSRQLAGTKEGMDAATMEAMEGQAREEWMVVPGKFDFLSAVKTGKSRKFGAQSSSDVPGPSVAMDPKMQAEIDSIKEAHEQSRGPSLMEQHREKIAQEKAAAAKSGNQDSWQWNREKDLDSGRRVDKDALQMILGGAGSELKTKFHGGFQ